MSSTRLTMGPFTFENLELPEKIYLKTRQRLFVHHLGSGGSVTDSLGTDYQSLRFKGTFTGPHAVSRAHTIEQLRMQGMPLLFRWDSVILKVNIQEFLLTYKSSQWIDYRLACLVVQTDFVNLPEIDTLLVKTDSLQIRDAMVLLQEAGVVIKNSQLSALTTLVQMNFDIPPMDSINAASGFSDFMENSVVKMENKIRADILLDFSSSDIFLRSLTALIANAGQHISGLTALNRIRGMIVQARRMGSS